MGHKIRYEIDLEGPLPGVESDDWRPVTEEDRDGLAELMLDAYRGTIDYEGETLEDAIHEVTRFLRDDDSMLEHSLAVEVDGALGSAVLVSMLRDEPFIGYVMTRRDHKRTGLARHLVAAALGGLAGAGHRRVTFYITDGNEASERLFASLGSRVIPD